MTQMRLKGGVYQSFIPLNKKQKIMNYFVLSIATNSIIIAYVKMNLKLRIFERKKVAEKNILECEENFVFKLR